MYRASFAIAALIAIPGTIPSALAQTIEVASISKATPMPVKRAAIRAKCTFPDGTLVAEQLVEVDPTWSPEQKRHLAEEICEPIMTEATAKCDELANRVERLTSERRLSPPQSYREHQLEIEIKKTLAGAPAYCDKSP